MSGDPAERFVRAIAERDRLPLQALLSPDVNFRGLTPGRYWEAGSPAEVAEILFDHWFEETDHIEAITRLERGEDLADVKRVGYRFDVTNDSGPQVVEQQAYYRVSAGRLSYLRILCSGFRPRPSS
ncbi:hypothetical protein O7606_27095 [Micromonospora sp. WMMD882]|uniref:hypothetical protein n=1 Tax=Micromonospora sp. WMMD882 TaxID=3015151 RepID=UPI00248CB073|nr:hypothetical protein [Micromonospora sp. WMMD882]WBB79749.1 hypothetical protein O7606_27095 [Micromonospora sp. WMMD882]